MSKPLEYLSLASLIEYEELVVSQVPAELVPEDDRYSENFYSFRIWRPSGKDLVDTMRWRDRFRTIFNILFIGRCSENSLVLSKAQIMKLSSWVYHHDDLLSTDEGFAFVSKG